MEQKTITIDTSAGLQQKTYDVLPIYSDKHPALSMKAVEFDFKNPRINPEELAIRLTKTMHQYHGVGLAAVQCNILLRVFALATEEGTVCFNPTILGITEEVKREREGCLSFPGLFLPITRAVGVHLEWYDWKGEKHTQEFAGLTARTILHEYDHLEGKVFTSYVGNLTVQMAKKKRKKMIKRYERAQQHKLLLSAS